jgi:hypothetical protein
VHNVLAPLTKIARVVQFLFSLECNCEIVFHLLGSEVAIAASQAFVHVLRSHWVNILHLALDHENMNILVSQDPEHLPIV